MSGPTVPQRGEAYEHGINSKGHNGGGFLSGSGRQEASERARAAEGSVRCDVQ